MIIGFLGCSNPELLTETHLVMLINEIMAHDNPHLLHTGLSVADEAFHEIGEELQLSITQIPHKGETHAQIREKLVNQSDLLIAFPLDDKEDTELLKSISYARQLGKEVEEIS